MGAATTALWALWIIGGGQVNGGYLAQPQAAAYFATVEDCEATRHSLLEVRPKYPSGQIVPMHARCIQARYVTP